MLPVVSLLLLALAVSLDGFGVGVTYGLRKIRIPLLSIAIISCCSGLVIFISMQIGAWMSEWVHPGLAQNIGAFILVGIGLWAWYQLYQQHKEEAGSDEAESEARPEPGEALKPVQVPVSTKEIIYIELRRFGLVIQILRKPSIADMDRSGIISAYEATLLGMALSLDAFGAGVGAALLGFTPWLTAAVIALASGIFLSMGLRTGFRYAGFSWMRPLSVIPGFVLIIMGIMKLF
ncbi:sporulation membrane protein YtaF [Paenibacillus puerhi]|uniref:sporulation membrane protein YtaF n=1 Tax=Paenibacillus puerhi TaxID=2692622 RepID=UPI00135BDCE8|nr:sporulation membrane protein YtaF [Paenibacillus puerhi]